MEEIKIALGKRVRELRLSGGMTQEKLSEKAGLSLKHFGELERGRGNPTLENLVRLAEALNITLAELFDLDHLRLTEEELKTKMIGLVQEASESQLRLIYRLLSSICI